VFRHSTATIGACVAFLFFPIVALNLVPERWARWLERTAPLAGIAIQDTTGRVLAGFGGGSTDDVQVARDGTMTITHPPMPIGHWAGLCVAAAWTLGALVVGYLVLRRRDV